MNPQTQLPPEMLAVAAILERGSESVRAVLESEENRFTRALADLRRLSEAEGIPIAVVGGLNAILLGYPTITQDVDIAVGRTQLESFVKAAPRYGFRVAWEAKSGWHILEHGDVKINVVPEGAKARNSSPTTIPGPTQLGVQQGLGYASLAGWLELKLSSARLKDLGQIGEVLKKTDPAALNTAREQIGQVHHSYLELLDRLVERVQEERAQEEERKPPTSEN